LFEGFGLVAAEALMQGCPVLGSKVGVFPEIIASNTNGLLFETGNSTHLALQLQNIRQQINEGIYNREQIQCKADLLFSVKQYMTGLMQILSPS
jgi:glycosyltransferase involved in cell wall biosynthesis